MMIMMMMNRSSCVVPRPVRRGAEGDRGPAGRSSPAGRRSRARTWPSRTRAGRRGRGRRRRGPRCRASSTAWTERRRTGRGRSRQHGNSPTAFYSRRHLLSPWQPTFTVMSTLRLGIPCHRAISQQNSTTCGVMVAQSTCSHIGPHSFSRTDTTDSGCSPFFAYPVLFCFRAVD